MNISKLSQKLISDLLAEKNIVDIEVVEGELGDLFFNLISICMRLGINLDDLPHLAEQTLLKFEERKEQYKYNCTIDAQEEAPIYRDQCIKVGDTYLDHEPVINPNSNVDIVCRRCGKEIELHKVICKYVTLKKNG